MEYINNPMTLSELSGLSDIPITTVKFYIRKGLVPKPQKNRGTKASYSFKHLKRLKLIKKMQKEGNISLGKISEIINIIEDDEKDELENKKMNSSDIKPEIIDSATTVFRNKGYEKTTISDIVDCARIGRSTFYKHFNNKKDLFIECVKKIIFSEMKRYDANDVKDEKDILNVFDKHAKAYYNANPLWIDMVNILRAAAINDPEEFTDKLDEVIHLKINMLKRGLDNGIKQGLFRKMNSTLMTAMLLGLQDYSAYFSKDGDKDHMESLYEDAKDIILYGILNK
jgi:AcrR family transcriptional regulator